MKGVLCLVLIALVHAKPQYDVAEPPPAPAPAPPSPSPPPPPPPPPTKSTVAPTTPTTTVPVPKTTTPTKLVKVQPPVAKDVVLPTKPPVAPGCISDTLILIDATSSVRDLFEQHKLYASNIINELNISPEGSHVGVLLYASRYHKKVKVSLGDPQDKANISAVVKKLPFYSGVTATGSALKLAIEDLEHRRRNVPTNVVVITDGFSFDIIDEPVAALHKMENVHMYSVALGAAMRKVEMLMIAGQQENFFTSPDSYNELVQRIQKCDQGSGGKGVQPSPATQGQAGSDGASELGPDSHSGASSGSKNVKSGEHGKKGESIIAPGKKLKNNNTLSSSSSSASNSSSTSSSSSSSNSDSKEDVASKKALCKYDIIFIMDASGSLKDRFQHQVEMATELIDLMPANLTQFGVIRYSGKLRTKLDIPLCNNLTTDVVKAKFLKAPFMGGTTYTDKALEMAFTELSGPRARLSEAKPMVVVFTDGFSRTDPLESARKLHSMGAEVLSVGIADGLFINKHELRDIASGPEDVFTDENMEDLKKRFASFNATC